MSCAPPQPLRPPPAAPLAPGFRFHPTDEELVGYYLKRKVLGRPFRVDAISEIDLYKSDPWDLPGKSRIQSRDMEWYFFSGLDKKYPNRSLTNRATGSGYWKTTGKDRAVCRGGRTVGMKKTLVFHIGRAPKGERTNWVMHEYRLEDVELARAGIPQDAFVVCRIFQKSGPGPQNGAQYGAPLVEEWEDDDLPVINEEGSLIVVNNSVAEVDGDEQNKDMGVQDENATLFVEPDDQGELNDFVNSDSLVKVCQKQGLHNDVDGNTGMTELRSHKKLGVMGGYGDAADSNQSPSILEDGYLELNDFACPVECDCHESVACPEEILKNEDFANAGITYPQELHDIKEYLNTTDLNNDFYEQFPPSETGEDNFCVELDGFLCTKHGDYYSGEPADDGLMYFDAPNHGLMYFDAPNHYPRADHGSTSMMNSCIDVTMANSDGPDPMDELLAYFDATENMQPSDLDLQNGTFSNQPNMAPVPSAAVGGYSTSTSLTPDVSEHSSSKSVANQDEPDEKSDNSWDKALSKHLFSMLDAISPPPAFAAEYPVKGSPSVEQHPAALPSSSIRITAGLIQIHGATMSGNGREWSMQKNVDAGFILSHGTTRGAITGNMTGFERMSKMPGGIRVFILRNSFYLLFLSVLFLAASFKIGVYICTR